MDLLPMADHSLYIWSAYSIAFVASAWLILWPWYRHRQFFQHYRQPPKSASDEAESLDSPRSDDTGTTEQ